MGKQTATKLGMMKVGIDVGAVTSHAEQFRHEFPEVFTDVTSELSSSLGVFNS